MKIMHVLLYSLPDVVGYTTRSHEILVAQRSLGIDAFAVTSPLQKFFGQTSEPYENIQDITYYRTDQHGTSGSEGARSLLFFLKKYLLYRQFKENLVGIGLETRPDLVHGHSYFYSGYPASCAARKMGVPFVYELRGLIQDSGVTRGKFTKNSLKYRYISYMEAKTFRAADRIVTISKALCNYLYDLGIPEEKVVLVPNGVDTCKFSPQPRDNELALQYKLGDKCVLGFIGSFFAYEGLAFLLRNIGTVLTKEKDTVLLLIGAGEDEKNLRKIISELHMEDRVILTGRVQYTEILRYYSLIDIFIYPRLKDAMTETVTPLKPLEAMSMGKAVIGRNIGGLRELINHGESGLLFNDDKPEELQEQCLSLIRDSGYRDRLGATARQQMLDERSWFKLADRYKTLYTDLLF